jgi:hypothetical protein
MNRDSRVRRNPEVVGRDLAENEGGVLLHLQSGAYHGLNRVGLIVWQLLDEERTVSELVDAVRARFDGAPPKVDDDVIAFLQSALERDLVQLVE